LARSYSFKNPKAGRNGGCPVLVFGITTALLKK